MQHPYLANEGRPLKRKHSYYTSASSEVASASSTNDSPYSDASDLPAIIDSADTTIDASQGSYRPLAKRRRHQTLGMEQDFDELAIEQSLRIEVLQGLNNSGGETPSERMQRFWEMDGEIEVEMDADSHSVSSIMRPSSVHSPEEQRPWIAPVASGSNWYETEKDRIVITSLESDDDSRRNSPLQNVLALENGELVSKVVVNALKGPTSSSRVETGFGPGSLFDARRWGDLTALERIAAGMSSTGVPNLVSDEEMFDVTPSPVSKDESAMDMDVEEL